MLVQLRRSVIAAVLFFVLCGVAYPLAETGLAQVLFPHQANGSLGPNGSSLIGQQWKGAKWFHGRNDGDNPLSSGASNLGPHSKALATSVSQAVRHYHQLGVNPTADLVTGSGSGLDPDISLAGAQAQAMMVAHARHLSVRVVKTLIMAHTSGQQYGFLGSQYVNVLTLNEALAHLVVHR